MQNIDVRFNAYSNFAAVERDLATLQAQAASLANVFKSSAYARTPALVDVNRWRASTRAVHEASNAYRNAASSSGLFNTQQIRATSEAERYTKALQQQKLTLADMRKHKGIMREVYRDQLRMQRMQVQYWGTDSAGRAVTDIAVPRNVPRDLDTMNQRMGMFSAMAKSAGHQMVNLGKNIQWAGRQLTVGFSYPVALFGAAAGVMAFKVEDAFAKINKVYDVSAEAQKNEALRAKELNDVRTSSMEMATKVAREYGLTVEKTLAVEQELAATGLTGDKLMGATKEVQRISALGDIDPAMTTDMVVALQTAFSKTIKDGDDLTEVLNFMNATSNATSLSLQDIAEATPRAASGLAQLGVDAKEMTVMLVAMREAGIDAAEGANALKSATTRLLNPAIVNKAAGIYEKAGAAFDLNKIVGKADGNLFDFINLLGKATAAEKNLTAEQKASAVAALFGTYQFNRLNAAIVNMGEAQVGTNNQTAKANLLMGENAEALALMAENSRKAMVENPAGRFKQAWADFQVQLAEMGGPFLDAATKILGAFSKVAEIFNDMPAWQKKVIMFTIAIAAIAGPVIMIGGLFANLAGQFIKGVGAVGALMTRFKIFTTQEVAAAKTTDLVNNKLMTQKTAMQNLAAEIQVLAAAYKAATDRALQFAAAATTPAVRQSVVRQGPSLPINPATGMPMTPQMYQAYQSTNRYPAGSPGGVGGRYMSEKQRLDYAQKATKEQHRQNQARLRAMADERRANAGTIAAEKKAAAQAERRQQAHDRMKNAMNGQNVAMGVAGVSMAVLASGADGTAASIAKMALLGTFVVPAAIALVRWMGAAVVASAQYMRNMMGAAASTRAAAAGMATGILTGLGKFAISATGIVSIVAAVGAGFYLWKKHVDGVRNSAEALRQSQDKAQATLVNSTKAWAEATGEAYQNYVKYNAQGEIDVSNKKEMARQELIKFYKDQKATTTIGGKTKEVNVSDQWNGRNGGDSLTDIQKDFTLQKKVIELLQMGKSIDEVRAHLSAFMEAMGESAGTAQVLADQAMYKVGDLKEFDWQAWMQLGLKSAQEATQAGNTELAKSLNESVGLMYADAFKNLNRKDRKGLTDMFVQSFQADWSTLSSEISKTFSESGLKLSDELYEKTPGLKKQMDELFNLSGGNLRGLAMEDLDDYEKRVREVLEKIPNGTKNVDELIEKIRNLIAAEDAAFGAAGVDFALGPETDKMYEFTNSLTVKLQEAETRAEKLRIALGGMFDGKLSAGAGSFIMQFRELQNMSNTFGQRDMMQAAWAEQLKSLSIMERIVVEYQTIGKLTPEVAAGLQTMLKNINFDALPKEIQDIIRAIARTNPDIKIDVDAKEVDKAKAKVDNFPNAINIGLNIQAKQVGGMVRDAMSSVQNEMADSAMDRFNNSWDARIDGAQAANDRASDAMSNRMDRRKEALENYYKKREDLINREIKAEERADTIRQRLFDRERTRLQRLAELQNQNIDFNVAVNEGRLDDAAKIGNDAAAKTAVNQLDDEQKAAEERSADRRERLEKRIEALNERREKQLKRLDKLQERMRQHMERAQESQIAGLERQRAAEEASLSDRLELFKSYTGRNQKDLEAWMKKVGLTYDDFGIDVRAKGESWSKFFQDRLSYHIRRAGVEVSNDNMWESVGANMANRLLKGLGFKNLADFQKFVQTGQKGAGGAGGFNPLRPFGETRHTGGEIGSGGGSRGNIPNTYKGLHRSETIVRAQKGEYMVNRKDAARNRGLLDAINSGTDVGGIGGLGGGVGLTLPKIMESSPGYGGPAGLLMGAMSNMFGKGVDKAFHNAYQTGLVKAGRNTGGRYTGKAYGSWDAEQMRNAATIASVGSGMGMTARDLMIGIMTSIAESGLRNVNYGDRDSVGLFQQRTSQGWGTIEQIMNPQYAARKFFEGLKGIDGRAGMPPWLAAQAVQRSAFSDGSNYQKWWAAAQGIFKNGLKAAQAGSAAGSAAGGSGYAPGSGGRHRPISGPVTNGLHGGNSAGNPPAVDMAGPTGRPVYAVSDGVITESRDIAGPRSTDSYRGDGPYGSFGRMIQLRTNTGAHVLYAHLSRRSVGAGQQVKGGARIGFSGNTGNSSGPHLHFGATNGPYAWLRTGGTVRHDNTPAILHRDETVLTSSLTRKFKDNVASGGGDRYDITIDLRGAAIHEDVDIERAVNKAIDARESRRGRSRKVTD